MSPHLSVWHFLAGLALFVYAMGLLEASLKQLAGRSLKKFLEKQTSSKLKAISGGALVTAVLQSSSIVNLTVLAFVGAGILSMKHALSVMMGANLGTTLSNWIIVFLGFKMNLEYITYPILGMSLFGLFFLKNNFIKGIVHFTIGFSLLFISIEWMKTSAMNLMSLVSFNLLNHYSPYLFIIIGFLLTALIQSSSAMMVITLTAIHIGSIDFIHAAGIVIGSELGTSIKVVFGGLAGSIDKRRVAFGNFYFNLFTLIISAVLLYPLTWLILDVLIISDPLIALVFLQSGINLLAIIIAYPFIGYYADWIQHHFQTDDRDRLTKYLHNVDVEDIDQAISALYKELQHLIHEALRIQRIAFHLEQDERQLSIFTTIHKQGDANYEVQYARLKILHGEVLKYITRLSPLIQDKDANARLVHAIEIARNTLRAAKNIKDIKHNLEELENSTNDVMFERFVILQRAEESFINKYEKIIAMPTAQWPQPIHNIIQQPIQEEYDKMLHESLQSLQRGQISEAEISSLMNLYREIYSAHKAWSNILEEYMSV